MYIKMNCANVEVVLGVILVQQNEFNEINIASIGHTT